MPARGPANARLTRNLPTGRPARATFRRHPVARALAAAWLLPVLAVAVAHCPSWALPTGAELAAGQATVQQPNALTLQINQTSPKAVLNWQSFGIGRDETVRFVQPSASAITLNRVLGSEPSAILGRLNANGQVFLLNPNGVLFGASARVDVGGIVASTLGLSNTDFLAGRYAFSADGSTASVSNAGSLRAAEGGYIVLLGNQAINTGTLAAPRGSVAMGAGERISLDLHGDGLLSLAVDAAAAKALVSNAGSIEAAGGAVMLSARARNALMDTVLNVEGTVRATSLVERHGSIYLDGGESGVTRVSGTLDASGAAPGLTGGRVTVLGDKVGLFGDAALSARGPAGGGQVLIGGNWQGQGPERNAQMSHVAAGVRIDASATGEGNGGTVVVWSDDTTRFLGAADARGGAVSGNGGFVEVSGKKLLDFRGSSDRSAAQGLAGLLLLDPTNMTINNAVDVNVTAATPFAPVAAGVSTLTWATLLGAGGLGGGPVTVTTVGSPVTGAEAGDITIAASPAGYNTANALTLTTAAGGGIRVNAAVSNAGNGGLNLNAGTGGVQFNDSVTLTGGSLAVNSGGAVTQTAAVVVGGATTISAGANPITLDHIGNNFTGAVSVTNSGANNVTLRDVDAIVLGTVGTANNLSVNAVGITQDAGGVVVGGSSSLSAGAGAITLTTPSNDFTGAVTLSNSGANDVSLRDTNAVALAASSVGRNLAVQSNGALTQTGALTVPGTSSFTAGAGAITLSNVGNSFTGAVSLSNVGANAVSLVAANAVVLGTVGTADNLSVNAVGITQDAGGVVVGGTSSFTAAAGVITLTTASNDFTGAVTLGNSGANDVSLRDSNAVVLAASSVGRNLAVQSSGALTQTGALTVPGTSAFTAGAGAITLTDVGNNFTGAVSLSNSGANAVSLVAANAIVLGTVGTADNLSVSGVGITQDAGGVVVGGTSSLSAGAGAITLTTASNDFTGAVTLSNSGANDVSLRDSNALVLAASSVGRNLAVQSSGALTQTGALTVPGTSSFNASAGAITLTDPANNFTGAVGLSNSGANDVELTNATGTVLAASGVGRNLAVTAGGNITQNGALTVPGTGTFTVTGAGAKDVLLSSADNSLAGAVSISAANPASLRDVGLRNINPAATVPALPAALQNLDLQFTTASLTLPAINLSGNLSALAGSSITQAGALTVTGTSSFTASAGAITLSNAGNDFTGAVSLGNSGANTVSLVDTNAVVLGTVGTANNLSVNAVGITQDAGGIAVGGTSSLAAGAGAITLTTASNDFTGAVTLSNSGANDISIRDSNALVLAASSVGRNLAVQSSGALTQTGALTVPGTSSFSAGAGAISLADPGNDFTGAVTLSNSGTNDMSLRDSNAVTLAASSVGRNLAVQASGALTQTGALTVPGTSSFTAGAGAITLSNAGNNFTGAVSLNNVGANAVSLVAANAVVLGTVGTADNLSVNAVGITQDAGGIAVGGTSSLAAGAGAITLTTASNDFTGAVTLSNSGANDVSLRDSNAVVLAASSVGRNLVVQSSGALTQTGALTVPGTSSFTAGASAITLSNAGNNFTGAVSLSNVGANAVSLVAANAVVLGTVGTANNLSVNAVGITQDAGGVVVGGSSSLTAGAGAITLTTASNDFTGAVTLGNSGANDVSVADANAFVLAASSVGRNLTVQSNGAITQTGALTVPGTSSFTAGAGAITLSNAGNNFTGAISLGNSGANAVSVVDTNAIVLGAVGIANNLSVNAVGITQDAGGVVVGGTSSLTAGAGAITLTTASNDFTGAVTLSNSGANDVSIRDSNAVVLAASSIGRNLAVQSNGALTQTGALTVPGTSSFNAGAGAITLTNPGNSFSGAVTLGNSGANDVSLRDSNTVVLAASSVGRNLAVQSSGALTQTGALTVPGTSSFTAGAGAITLTTAGNDFGGAVSLSNSGANDVSLRDSNALVLGASSIGRNLAVQSSGALTQTGALTVPGTSSFTAGAGAITLTATGNTLTGAVSLSNSAPNDVDLTNASGTVLAASGVGRNLAVVAGGNITQSGALTVPGTSLFTVSGAGAKDVLLSGVDNSFTGTVTLSTANSASLRDVGLRNVNGTAAAPALPATLQSLDLQFTAASLTLPAVNLSGNLSALSGGSITQAPGALQVGGTSSLTASGSITLANAGNDFTGAVSLSNSGANDVSLRDSNAVVLAASSVGRNLAVQSSGALTQTGALTVPGTSSFTAGAGAITLVNPGNNFTGAVSLSNSGANDVSLRDSNALVLATSSVGRNLAVQSSGALTQTGALAVPGTSSFTAGAGAILLANPGNSFSGAVSLSNSGANAVSLVDSDAIVLGTVNTAHNLSVNAVGITQGAGSVVVGGTSSLAAGAGVITLANAGNNFTGAVSLSNTGTHSAAITTSTLNLGTSTVGGALTAVATSGGIAQTGVITTGANGSSFSTTAAGQSINLGSQVNAFGARSVGFNTVGAADVTVRSDALNLAASNVGGKLSVTTTTGGVTQAAAIAAATLELTTTNGNVSLNTPANAIANLGATALGTGALSVVNAGTLTVAAPVAATGGVALQSLAGNLALQQNLNAGAAGVVLSAPAGAVLQDAGRLITAGALGVEALAAPMVATNGPLQTVSANITGANNPFTFTQAGTFEVGNVESTGAKVGGVRTNNGTITLTATSGSLTMSERIDAGTASVNLAAGQGSITQAANGRVNGNLLTTSSRTGQTLGGANTVGRFNASNSNSGAVTLKNTAALLTLTGVTNLAANATATVENTGAMTVSGPVQAAGAGLIALSTSGNLALDDNLDAGLGGVALTALNGTITQAPGKSFTARELGVQATAAPALTTSGSLATIAARITGPGNPFAFTQAGTFSVGAVGSISGVSTSSGTVTLTASAGDLTMTQAVDAAAGAVNLTAAQGSITQAGSGAARGAILNTGSRTGQTLTGANAVGSFSATNNASGAITLANTAAPLLVTGISNAALNGNATVNNTGAMTIGGPVQTVGAGLITLGTSGNLALDGNLNAGTGGVVLSALAGTITQAPGRTITASSLGVEAAAAPSLVAGGSLNTIAANITGPGNPFAFSQAGTFDIGQVGALRGVTTQGGTVTLSATNGHLTLSEPVDAGAAGVNLTATQGSITQAGSGAVKGTLLTTGSASGQLLAGVNTVGSFSATNSTSGDITLANTAALLTVTGISNNAANGQVTVGNAGAITQGAGGAISTNGLLQTSSVTGQSLTGANTVGRFNATNTTSGDIVLNNTAAPLDITGISNSAANGRATVTNTGAISTSGAVSTAADGAITLQANNGSLALGQPVAAGGAGTVSLTSTGVGGAITQGAGGRVSTAGLLQTSSALGQSLTGANTVGRFNATNTTSGSIVLNNTAAPLVLTGISNAAVNGGVAVTNTGSVTTSGLLSLAGNGLITLASTGNLSLGGDVNAAGGGVVLSVPNGTVTQTPGTTITTSSLGVQANAAPGLASSQLATIAADITGAGNPFAFVQAGTFDIGTVGSVSGVKTRDGTVSLTSSAGNLTQSQAVDAGAAAVNLTATQGSITQAGSGAVKGTLLTTGSASGQLLAGANTVGSFSATNSTSGDITLANTAALLTVTGISNNAANGQVTVGNAGAITQGAGGAISTSGLLQTSSVTGQSLTGANTVSRFNATNTTSGDIVLNNTAAPLDITGLSNTAANGRATVTNTGAITTSGAVSTAADGPITLQANNGSLTLGAPVAAGGAGTVALSSTGVGGAVTLNAAVTSASGTISATSAGAITQGANGRVATPGLLQTSSALGQTLAGANTVGRFNATNTTSGSIVLNNTAAPLVLTGISNAAVNGGVAVTNTGALATTGATSTAADGPITLQANNGSLTVDQAVTSAGAGTVTLGSTGAGNAVALNALVATGSGTVSVNAAGAITQGAGGRVATTGPLQTASALGQAFTGANTVGGFSATNSSSGNIVLNNTAASLALAGISNAAAGGGIALANSGGVTSTSAIATAADGAISLQADNGGLTLGQAVAAGGAGTVVLTSTGAGHSITLNGVVASGSGPINANAAAAITQGANGAFSTSGLLQTTSVAGQTLLGANRVGRFNASNTASGDITLRNTAATLAVDGIVNMAANGNAAVTNAGALVTAGAVSTAAGGAISLQANDGRLTVGNTVTTGGAGTVSLTSTGVGGAIALDAAVASTSGTVSATSAGAITQGAGGRVSTTGLLQTASAMGQALTGANTVGRFNATNSTGGSVVLNNTAALLTVAGITNTAANGNATVTNAGALNTTGAIGTAADGHITLRADNGSLAVGSPVAAGGAGTVSLASTGAGHSITLDGVVASGSGTINAESAAAITQAANGAFSTSGLLQTASVTGQTLTGTNTVGRFNGTNSSSGDITLGNTAALLSVSGITNNAANGNVAVSNAGALTTTGAIRTAAGGAGAVAITSTGAGHSITVNDLVSSGSGPISANSAAALTQGAGGAFSTSGLLQTTSATGQALTGANTVGRFNATNSSSGDITLGNTAALLSVTGITNNAANGNVAVSNAGALTTTGAIRTAAGGAGAVAITSTGAGHSITVNDLVSSGSGPISVDSAAAIAQGAGGAFSTSGLLQTTSVTGQALQGANTVGRFNATNTASGDIALGNTAATLAITGISNTATGGSATVTNAGGITTSGAISTAADGPIKLQANNGSLTVGQPLAAGGAGTVSLASTGPGHSIVLDAAVASASGTLSATSAGAISQGANGRFSTPGLLQTASGLGQSLAGANAVGRFNATNGTSGNIVLNNAAAPLSITGITNAAANGTVAVTNTGAINTVGAVSTAANGDVTLQANSGSLVLRQPVTAGGAATVTLRTSGAGHAISQDANGLVTAGTLSLSTTDANVALAQAANKVARLQAVDLGSGALTFSADAAVLTATGITAQGGLDVHNTTGDITTAGDLHVAAGDLSLGATAAGKTVNLGGALTASGNLSLRTDGALDTGARLVRATGGSAALRSNGAGVTVGTGGLSAGTTAALTAGGAGSAITQRAGGVITADTLTLTTSSGSATLDAAANALARLGPVAMGSGVLGLRTAGALAVTGPVAAAGGVALDTGGALALGGPIDAGPGAVALSTRGGAGGTITQGAAGGITTASLSLKTEGANVSLDTVANAVTGLGPTALGSGALKLQGAGALTVTGAVAAAGGVTLNTAGALVLNNSVDAATGSVALRTSGGASSAISQSAQGRITAGNLSLATTDGNTSLDTAVNTVAQLGATALGTGALTLRNASGLTVTGAVAASGGVALTAGGPLVLNNTLGAGTGVAALATQGAGNTITQSAAGVISADTLTLATEGADATLNSATNALRQLGATALGTGRLNLLDAGGLTVAGPVAAGGVTLGTSGGLKVDGTVNAGSGTVALSATGPGNDITQASAGRLTAGALALDAGNVTLSQVAFGGAAANAPAGPGALAIQISAGDSVVITVTNAGVTLGTIDVGTLYPAVPPTTAPSTNAAATPALRGNFSLTTAGSIGQSASLKVSGDSRFVVGLADAMAKEALDVLLAGGSNLFGGSVSVTGANLENISLSAPTLQIGESTWANAQTPLLNGAGILGRNVTLKTDLLTSLSTNRDDVKGSIVVRDKGVLNLQAYTEGKEGSFGTPAQPVKVQFLTPLDLSQDTVNVLPAVGGVVYLVGPVAPAPFYSRGLRSVCYNFLGERCQRLNAPITQTALNAAYSELRRLIEEVLRSGYSKENVYSELVKGLVLESGMAPPALDDIAGDGIRMPH